MQFLEKEPIVNKINIDLAYDVQHKIGEGHFAEVNQCVCRTTKREYAAKFIMKDRMSASSCNMDIEREAKILTNLNHENIVKLHEVFYQKDSVVLILDLVTGGELFARVAECERLSEEEASNFVEQILLGVKHMHQLGVVHLDLKPENIMIEDLASRKIKIIDFGLARALNPGETFQDMAGTPEFCAPEIINYDPITLATDMWAIGVITYILLSGISPFAGDSQADTFKNILECVVDYKRDEIRHATKLAKEFIRSLLVKVPRKRASVHDCLVHGWIRPANSDERSCRRGSLISRTNLDGLRHFVAAPTAIEGLQAPSSPSLEVDVLGRPEHLPKSLDVTSNQKTVSSENRQQKHEDNAWANENSFRSKQTPKSRKTSRDEITTLKYPQSLPQITALARNPWQQKQLSSVHHPDSKNSLSSPTAQKTAVSGWRANIGHSLISRLGAAFHGGTLHRHSIHQSVQPSQIQSTWSKPLDGKTLQRHEKEMCMEKSKLEEETVLNNVDNPSVDARCAVPVSSLINQNSMGVHQMNIGSQHNHEPPERTTLGIVQTEACSTFKLGEIVNESTTSLPINSTIHKKEPSSRKSNSSRDSQKTGVPVQRGLQLGTVSRAIKEFEITASDSNAVYDSSMETGTQNLHTTASQQYELPRRIWDSHKQAKVLASNYRPRERNHNQVGRLQVFFETATNSKNKQPNGTYLDQVVTSTTQSCSSKTEVAAQMNRYSSLTNH